MRPITNPDPLTPDQRLTDLAGILATGILRLHARAALPQDADNCSISEKLAISTTSDLEVSEETVLSVHSS